MFPYELDFGGVLSQDAEVSIETGISGIVVSVPTSTATMVTAETALGSVDVVDGFTKSEGAFSTEAALREDGPFLRIRAGAVDLGHALGIEVVAEGVETHEEFEKLSELGCDVGQGDYRWSPHLPRETEELLASNHTALPDG